MLRSLGLLFAILFPAATAAEPDLSGTVPILDERFESALQRFDGHSGLWTTTHRAKRLRTNASEAVFLDYGILGDAADAALAPLHVITDDGLSLRSAKLPLDLLPILRDYMEATGQGARAAGIRYGVGQITTAQTWSQTYGYFEIEARMPRGKGRWPAFWLTFAGQGWPPEIDVVEAYGAGLDIPTKKDNAYNTAVFFDARDADGEPTHATDIVNPFAAVGEGHLPKEKERGGRPVFNFHHLIEAGPEFGVDIYDDFNVYAALWTPETTQFFFGKTRETLREVYRTPTPPDVHVPMYLIANDQFTAGFWRPRPEAVDRILDPTNDFRIRRIVVRALEPALSIDMAAGETALDDRASRISDTAGDDVIRPGEGFDLIRLTGGADLLSFVRGREQKIVSGFGRDDRVTLDGYPFVDSADVLSRLTQVGPDVWLPSGADPFWPHTIVFRDSRVEDFHADQFQLRWPVAPNIWGADAARAKRPQTDEDGDGVLTSAVAGAWFNDKGNPVRMVGTEATDRYMVANNSSVIAEPADGGLDTLITWISFTLPQNVEHGIVRGRNATLTGTIGDDRLEAESEGATLAGGPGDDLYVIQPDAVGTVIRIGQAQGHDRVRGFGPDDRLVLDPALAAGRANWRVAEDNGMLRVEFSDTQSLSLEGVGKDGFMDLVEFE